MEAADHDLHAGRAQVRAISTAREFVRLHADDADEPGAAVLGDPPRDLARAHAGIGLVHGHDVDRKIGAEQLPLGRAERKAIDRGKRVRRHGRAQPLHDAVIVVMRRLDENELKARAARAGLAHHPSIEPVTISAPRDAESPLKPAVWSLCGGPDSLKHIIPRRSNRLGGGLVRGPISAGLARLLELGDVLRQEVVEHGANGRDHRKLGDVVPGGRNRGAHEIGGKRIRARAGSRLRT